MIAPPLTGSYWFTRIVFLRGVALIYLVAFIAAFQQNIALIGDNGLLPARLYLRRIREAYQAPSPRAVTWPMVWAHPTLLWLAPPDRLDPWLRGIAACGAALSATVLLLGASNVPIQLALWVLYHSIVTVGQRWYSFGWESQVGIELATRAARTYSVGSTFLGRYHQKWTNGEGLFAQTRAHRRVRTHTTSQERGGLC
jgi:hypothetical protein